MNIDFPRIDTNFLKFLIVLLKYIANEDGTIFLQQFSNLGEGRSGVPSDAYEFFRT